MGKHDAPRGQGRPDRGPRRSWTGAWLRRIIRTFAASLSVVRQHPELWALPVLILVVASGIGVAGARLFPAYRDGHQQGWLVSMGLAAVAILVTAVLMLGNIALVQATERVLRARIVNPFALGLATRHWMALVRCLASRAGLGLWLLVVAVLTTATGPADWAAYLVLTSTMLSVGGSSAVKESYLLPPIIMIEGLPYKQAQERLTELVRLTWRGSDGATGLALAGAALYAPVLAVVLAVVWIGSGRIDLAAHAERPALLIVLGWGALVWVVTCVVTDLELAFGRLESA